MTPVEMAEATIKVDRLKAKQRMLLPLTAEEKAFLSEMQAAAGVLAPGSDGVAEAAAKKAKADAAAKATADAIRAEESAKAAKAKAAPALPPGTGPAIIAPKPAAPAKTGGIVPQPAAGYAAPALPAINAGGAVAPRANLGGATVDPDSPAFFRWLQEVQKRGELSAEDPMFKKKAWTDATPEEMARLKTDNPIYYKKFLSEMDLGTPGTKHAPMGGPENDGSRTGKPKGGQGVSGGGPAAPGLIEKTAGAAPDWLLRLGEVLQAGAAAAGGERDPEKMAYGRRLAKEGAEKKTLTENEFYEKMKALDFDYQTRTAAEADARARELAMLQIKADDERAKMGYVSAETLARIQEAGAMARTKYATDAAGKAAAAVPGDLETRIRAAMAEG